MSVLTVTNIGKAYKSYPHKWARVLEWVTGNPQHQKTWVLHDINFTIQAGESVGILGINGAGKSTLLKIITGTTQPTTGNVKIQGRIAALLELGMGFHADFTGRQNVYMAGQLLGYGMEEINRLMPEIEAFADIGAYIDRPVRVYSSGMQVRLAFSVATAIRPDILIVDEALSVGDVFFQQKCFERIRSFRRQGTTLLFVSHSMDAIYALCDRAVLLNQGHVEMLGSPKQVIDLYNARLALASNKIHHQPSPSPSKEDCSEETNAEAVVENTTILSEKEIGNYHNQGVEILSIRLLHQHKDCQVIVADQELTLCVRVRFHRPYSDPHIGFQIKNKRGEPLYMSNTAGLGQSIGQVQAHQTIEARFTLRVALAEGDYTVTVGVAEQDLQDGSFKLSLARKQDAAFFTVVRHVGGDRWAGLFNLAPTCQVYQPDTLPNIPILVTTSRAVLCLHPAQGTIETLHEGDGLYYGLARSETYIFVGARQRMVSSDVPVWDERGVIHLFDHALKYVKTLEAPFALRDLHGMAYDAGILWVTCSFDDMVAIWNGDTWEQWYPLGEPQGNPRDIHHFNTIFIEGDVLWLLAHNRGASEILAFSKITREFIQRIPLGIQAHDIWRENQQFFTCSSGEGAIVSAAGFHLATGHFPRGYLSWEGHRILGLSALAERHQRDYTTGFIRCYDEQWKLTGEIALENQGLVLALLPLSQN